MVHPAAILARCAFALLGAISLGDSPQETGAIEASSPARPGSEIMREEFFALELCATPAPDALEFLRAPRSDVELVGFVTWRRKRDDDGQRVEWDVAFPADATRLFHVERLYANGSKLIWREVRAGSGRTLSAEWDDGARGLKLDDWSGDRRTRSRIAAPEGALLPLYLLELVRAGDVEDGRFALFDPLSNSLAQVELVATYGASAAAADPAASSAGAPEFRVQRLVELRRADGTCAGSFLFCGEDLLAFQWQTGGLRARRITAEEYERRTAAPSAPLAAR